MRRLAVENRSHQLIRLFRTQGELICPLLIFHKSHYTIVSFVQSFKCSTSPAKGAGGGPPKKSYPKPRHWYSLELDVACHYIKLIEDPEYSTPVIPVYDLVYLSPAPASQVSNYFKPLNYFNWDLSKQLLF